MKTITINVSEPVYREFQAYAREHDRTTSELIRQAMEEYRCTRLQSAISLQNLQPVSLGKILRPLTREDDWLGEMLDEGRT